MESARMFATHRDGRAYCLWNKLMSCPTLVGMG